MTRSAPMRSDENTRPQTGDRMTREEFSRWYEGAVDVHQAELIEGVVYMPSPVSLTKHAEPLAALIAWLATYKAGTPGVQVATAATIRLGTDTELQPDALLRILPDRGGQSRDEDNYLRNAPEWIGEVSFSSASIDLHRKLDIYRRYGVREYLVWQVGDLAVDWHVLQDGQFQWLPADPDGIVRSQVFGGLWLDSHALRSGDLQRVLAVQQEGLQSDEHREFVGRLASFGG